MARKKKMKMSKAPKGKSAKPRVKNKPSAKGGYKKGMISAAKGMIRE